jgi:hypothetical protein
MLSVLHLSAAGRELLARLAIGEEWSEADAFLHAALARRVELGGRVWLLQTLDALAQVAAGLESSQRQRGCSVRANVRDPISAWCAGHPTRRRSMGSPATSLWENPNPTSTK